MLRRGLGLFSALALAVGSTGCLSDHCALYPEHCADIAASTESSSSDALDTSETTDTSDTPDLPAPLDAPTLELSPSQIKRFEFDWSPVDGVDHYQLFERADVDEAFVQIGGNLTGDSVAFTMPLHFRVNASYKLLACDPNACSESAVVDVVGNLAEAVGYFKSHAPGISTNLGASVALSNDGDTLVVGAPGHDWGATGAVHVFVRSSGVWSQTAYLLASNFDPGDRFGARVVLSDDGDTLAVGAPNEDSGASGVDGNQFDESKDEAGAVYVFVRNDGDWSQQAYVKPSNTDDHDFFGTGLALSGDGNTLAVGTRENNDSGAVYVFVRDDVDWSQQSRLEAFNRDDHDGFGASLALSADGNTLAAGASSEDSNATSVGGDPNNDSADDSGATYVYVRNNGDWSQQAYVKPSNTTTQHFFGASVALSGNGETLAVGAPGEAIHAGAVHLFVRSEGSWSQQAHATASNPGPEDSFGESVALSDDGDVVAVGARHEASHAIGIDGDQDDNSIASAGAVYVLTRSAGVWSQQAYVKSPNTGEDDDFGVSVALSSDGGTLAVGARGEAGGSIGIGGDQTDNSAPNAGAVYLY